MDIDHMGNILQIMRDMQRCPSSMHFNKLGGVGGPHGGKSNLALSWLATLLNVTEFRVRTFTHVLSKQSFDLSHYDGSRELATNRTVRTNVLSALASLCKPQDNVELAFHVDGHPDEYKDQIGLLDYLKAWIPRECLRRPAQPTVRQMTVAAIPRSPLSPHRAIRAKQDLIGLCDLLAGTVRYLASPYETKSVKKNLGRMLNNALRAPEQLRSVIVTRYAPPSRFEPFKPINEGWLIGRSIYEEKPVPQTADAKSV